MSRYRKAAIRGYWAGRVSYGPVHTQASYMALWGFCERLTYRIWFDRGRFKRDAAIGRGLELPPWCPVYDPKGRVQPNAGSRPFWDVDLWGAVNTANGFLKIS